MRRLLASALVAIATVGVFAASERELGAAYGGLDPAAPLRVTSVSPDRNQTVLPDLSDPGLSNVIRVRFSTYPRAGDVIDEGNGVNGLSTKCVFRDQAFAPVRATSTLRRNVLMIDPFSAQQPVIGIGIYTLSFKASIRSVRGRLLNEGAAGFTTRFSVGSGWFPIVLAGVSPRDGQTGVGLRRDIVATFDVPVEPESAWESVRLEDRSTTPPTPIDALVTVERRGLDVVVHPAYPGLPPGAEIALVIRGRGTATEGTVLRSADGIEFKRDWGPRWWPVDTEDATRFLSDLGGFDDVTGEFTMTFRTRGE
jgi:hypothetical protein